MDYRQITWLASYPKSGNTWARAFFDAYFLGDVNLNEMVSTVTDDVAGLYAIGDGTKPKDMPVQVQYLMRPAAMVRLVSVSEGRGIPLIVKTHAPHLCANGIEMLPESLTKAVIHIIRDPRDVAPSFAKHMGVELDQSIERMRDDAHHLRGNEHRVFDLVSSWDKHALSYLNADTHNVRTFLYEDMRADPVAQFSEMLRHAGIDADQERVEKAVAAVDISRLRAQEQENGFRESSPHAQNQFFGSGKVGGWKGKLTPGQQHRLERAFGRVMKRLGYLKQRVA